MEIKKLLEEENYIIIPDTNVLLNIYRYSPEFSEFGIQCLKKSCPFFIFACNGTVGIRKTLSVCFR